MITGNITSVSVPPSGFAAVASLDGDQSASPSVGEVVIAAAGSLSGAIDLGAQRLHRIVIPASWTAADITFQSSSDGITYNDVFDMTDGEVKIASSLNVAGRTIVVNQAIFYGIRFLKIRSGTSAAPVNQAAARTILLRTVAR